MKNFPNQASTFPRVRATLVALVDFASNGGDATDDEALGYELARKRAYTFRGLDSTTATAQQIEARIQAELMKPRGSQGAQTNARELRRTLRELGWIDDQCMPTSEGTALLNSAPNSTEEQWILVEGLLSLEVGETARTRHHPVLTMLKLLAVRQSNSREGLELALEPIDDSAPEFQRVLALYGLTPAARAKVLDISEIQQANAVKVFPSLAVYAGLVVQYGHVYSLSQDGWAVLRGPSAQNIAGASARATARKRRRTTTGRLVTSASIALRIAGSPPKTLSPEDQRLASDRLAERTTTHQRTVKELSQFLDGAGGAQFEDAFSYDLLWVPDSDKDDALLFEVKSIVSATDGFARIKDAVGQLAFYSFFNTEPTVAGRPVRRLVAVNAAISDELVDYLTHQEIGAVLVTSGGVTDLNSLATQYLLRLRPTPGAPSQVP